MLGLTFEKSAEVIHDMKWMQFVCFHVQKHRAKQLTEIASKIDIYPLLMIHQLTF